MEQSSDELLPVLPPGTDWLPVGTGESGDRVFRRGDGAAYAKVATGERVALLDGERRRTAWLAATGIPCPAVLDWMEEEGSACLVTAAVPGVPASALSGPELARAWPAIARLVGALHDLPVTGCPFERRLATMFRLAEDVVARGAVNPDFLDSVDRGTSPAVLLGRLRDELPRRLAAEPGDLVVCHGDACLPNILLDPDTLRCTGLIDLGRLGVADRYADLSLLVANARESWDSPDQARTAFDTLFSLLALPHPDRERLDFYLRLDPLTWG
jgi:streptomycin 3"-kinase